MNGVFNFFDSFNNKFSPGNRLIDLYSSHFSFYHLNRKNSNMRKTHLHYLDEIVFNASSNPKMAVDISDTSIKNWVTTSIAHVHTYDSSVVKIIYHTVNITSTEVELFAIRYGLNQALQLTNIEHIIVITDAIHTTKRIFDLSIHLYQIQLVVIFKEIREFFKRNDYNSIDFWDCSSQENWLLHSIVNKETKKFNLSLVFLCKSSWDFSWKEECNNIIS